MSHFAEIDPETNIVKKVLVIEQDVIDSGDFGDPKNWIQTSYNTYAGKHKLGGVPLRKNFAGIGMTYDSVRDAFIPQQPFGSWKLNEKTCQWEAPRPYPLGKGFHTWNEEKLEWTPTGGG